MAALVSRVYDIQITGYQDALKNLQALTAAFAKMDEVKRKTDEQLKQAVASGNTQAVEALTIKVKELETSLKNLDKQREKSAREVKLLAEAEKLQADATLKGVLADKAKTSSLIEQDKEIDRQIALTDRKLQQDRAKEIADEKELQRLIKLEEAERKKNQAASSVINPRTGATSTNQNVNVNANTQAADDNIKALKASLKALEAEYETLSKSSIDFETKNKTLSESIKATKLEIIQRTEATKLTREETKKVTIDLEVEAGAYHDVVTQLKELRPFVQNKLPTSTATLDFRGQTIGITEATQKFKELSATEQDFRRQFAKDSLLVGEYSSGIAQAFSKLGLTDVIKKQKDDINNQLNQLKNESQQLASQLQQLGTTGTQAFGKIDTQLRENIQHQENLQRSLQNIDGALQNTGGVGTDILASIKEGFSSIIQNAGQFALSFVGIQALFQSAGDAFQQGIGTAAVLSDSTTTLEVELGKAAGGADNLVEALSKIDTRTQLTGLVDMANIASKAGVAENEIVGVVTSLDKIKTAFGSDFGDVEAGTESLVKLINIFEGADKVNGENLLKAGNAVRTLANESVASVPFLNDFAQRMAGLKGIADISLPSVLGLASGFEQFGQSSEVAGTALTQIIPKLATNTEKYAKVAGVTQQAFSELLKNNPAEALIKVSEGLVKSASGIEEISKNFADSELGKGRIAAVLGTVGAKADDFRKSIKSAAGAYEDTANIETAFAAKNENLAATLDKISKKFADAAGSKTFMLTLTAISSLVLLLINNLGIIAVALGLYATTWSIANVAMIRARATALLSNIAFTAQYAIMVISETITASYTVAVNFLSSAFGRAAITSTALGAAIRLMAGPIGIIITIIGLTVVSFKAFGNAVVSVSDSIKTLIKQQGFYRDSLQQAKLDIAEQISAETTLVGIINSHTAAQETKEKALKDLIALNPAYLSGLTLQNVALSEGKAILDAYNNSLLVKAQRQAADAIKTREYNELIQAQTVKMDLERKREEAKTGKKIGFGDLSDDEKKFFPSGLGTKNGSLGLSDFFNEKVFDQEFDKAIKNVNTKIREQQIAVDGAQRNAVAVAEKSTLADKSIFIVQQTQINNRITGMRANLSRLKEGSEEYNKIQADLNVALAQREGIREKILGSDKKADDPAVAIPTGGTQTIDELKQQLKTVNSEIATIDLVKNKTAEQIKELKKLRLQRQEILREIKEQGGSTSSATTRPRADRLTVQDQNQFKDIDAARDSEITDAKRIFASKYIDEKVYLNDVLTITKKSISDKLKVLDGSNAEERKKIAELNLERVTLVTETDKKLFDLYQIDAENFLKQQTRKAQSNLDTVLNDPNSTFKQKSDARQAFNLSQLNSQQNYNNQILGLERRYNQSSVANELSRADALKKILSDIRLQRLADADAELADIQKSGDESVARFKSIITAQKVAILESKRSSTDKSTAITEIDKQENIGVLSREVKSLQEQIPLYKQKLASKQITEKEYQDWYDSYVNKIVQLNEAVTSSQTKINNVQDLATNKLSKLFGFEKGSGKEKLLGETIAESYQFAQDAASSFFESEKQQIENSRNLANERIDIEKNQALKTAQSQAERESIEKQAAVKKKAADKKAFDEQKKVQVAQAQVNLALQLSNLAVIAFAPGPANLLTLGAAGAIMYAIQAAIAIAGYAANVGRINAAKAFATGGKVEPERLSNGRITSRQNISTQANGDNILATVRVGEVILNEEQQRKLGGAATFKRLGVPGFATGGLIGTLGGTFPGQNLLPPVNPASFLNINNNIGVSEDVQELKKMVAVVAGNVNNVTEHVRTLRVVNIATETAAVNNKLIKASNIGTL